MKLGIAEVLDLVSKAQTKEERISVLRKNDGAVLREILRFAFDPTVEWDLPPGKPPYNPSVFLDQQSILFMEMRRMYLFMRGGHPGLTTDRRQKLFIQLLESLDPADAALLVAVKDRKMPYKGINRQLIKEALGIEYPKPPKKEKEGTEDGQELG